VAGSERIALRFLADNGFQWQESGTVKVNGATLTVPSYWADGGATVGFNFDGSISLYPLNSWPVLLPGPGAVAVRSYK
jgi:hypothetical protein